MIAYFRGFLMNAYLRNPLKVCLGLIAAIAFASRTFASEPPWVEVRSPHFSVVTDAGDKRGREVAMRFEQMRSVFETLMVKANVNIPVPLQIVAFRNTKELRQFAPLWNGKPTEVAGLFQSGADRSFIMLDMSVENPWTVVFHEYAHQLMNGILAAQTAPWFEEGFAEYFSTVEVDNKQARLGKVPEYEYQILRQNGMMKVADLFRVRQYSSTYNESGDHRSVFYAESGIVVHYLYDNQWIPKLGTYFDLVTNQNVPVESAIQQTLGISAAQFDKALWAYVNSGRYKYYAIPNPANIVSADYAVKPLTVADGNAILADIHLHSLDYHDKALEEFQDILKTDPNNEAACRGMGYAYLQKGDFDQATGYFKRAVQADSSDPRAHYYYALLMSRQGTFVDRSLLPAMTKELETSIALDANFADAYSLLAFAQTYGGDPAKGLETIRKAVAISPRNESYRVNLARMYMNNQKPEQAIAILQALQKIQNPQMTNDVNQTLAQAQELKARLQSESQLANSSTPLILGSSAPSNPSDPQQEGEESARTRLDPNALDNRGAAKFLQGKVMAVDCTAPPSAALTVLSGTQTWKMKVENMDHVILIGADKFSCSWSQQKIAFNYRETGANQGSVISLEIQ